MKTLMQLAGVLVMLAAVVPALGQTLDNTESRLNEHERRIAVVERNTETNRETGERNAQSIVEVKRQVVDLETEVARLSSVVEPTAPPASLGSAAPGSADYPQDVFTDPQTPTPIFTPTPQAGGTVESRLSAIDQLQASIDERIAQLQSQQGVQYGTSLLSSNFVSGPVVAGPAQVVSVGPPQVVSVEYGQPQILSSSATVSHQSKGSLSSSWQPSLSSGWIQTQPPTSLLSAPVVSHQSRGTSNVSWSQPLSSFGQPVQSAPQNLIPLAAPPPRTQTDVVNMPVQRTQTISTSYGPAPQGATVSAPQNNGGMLGNSGGFLGTRLGTGQLLPGNRGDGNFTQAPAGQYCPPGAI